MAIFFSVAVHGDLLRTAKDICRTVWLSMKGGNYLLKTQFKECLGGPRAGRPRRHGLGKTLLNWSLTKGEPVAMAG
jgi:hypothetical protein